MKIECVFLAKLISKVNDITCEIRVRCQKQKKKKTTS